MRFAAATFLVALLFIEVDLAFCQGPDQQAWDILDKGHFSHSTKDRINAVHALGVLRGNLHAEELAEEAIRDKKPEVRAAAALTLGRLGSTQAIPLLKEALKDKKVEVVLAASSALLSLGDLSGYVAYRDVLAKKRKTGEGAAVDTQRLLANPKAMSLMMLGVAAGFAPYAGYGWAMFEVLSKDYAGPVRVEAARKLATDRDPETQRVLVKAASDKAWKIRVAALEALAQQADPHVMDTLSGRLSDKKQIVRCAAAAGIIRLSSVKEAESMESGTLR